MLLRDERIVQVGPGDTVVAGGNMRRQCLVISAPPLYSIFVRFAGTAADGFGLELSPGTLPLQIDQSYVGTALTEEIHIVSPGGTQNVYLIDLFSG